MESDLYIMKYKDYKLKREKSLRVLGNVFIRNNINKGKLIYKNKKYNLDKEFLISNIKENELKLIMILNKDSINIKRMFENCIYLLSIKRNINYYELYPNEKYTKFSEDALNLETLTNEENSNEGKLNGPQSSIAPNENHYIEIEKDSNKMKEKFILSMNRMFYNCQNLTTLFDISNLNTKEVIDISEIFYNCLKLKSLPNISNWNTENVIYMNGIFYNCSKLKSLPNISKWNTENVIDISEIFYNCSKLISLPNISKWKTNNVIYMNGIFRNCSSLKSLPDISVWNTENVKYLNKMFWGCSKLTSLPDISK